ncbi:MAG: hypothetical protein ACLFR6_04540 [Salinarchaeum sp.]
MIYQAAARPGYERSDRPVVQRAVIGIETNDGYNLYRYSWDETGPTPGACLHAGWRPPGNTREATGLARTEVYSQVDWLLDVYLYMVSETGVETRVLVPLRVESGVPGAATADGPGAALVPTDTTERYLRDRMTGARESCGLLVDGYGLTQSDAEAALRELVTDWSDDVIIHEPGRP